MDLKANFQLSIISNPQIWMEVLPQSSVYTCMHLNNVKCFYILYVGVFRKGERDLTISRFF